MLSDVIETVPTPEFLQQLPYRAVEVLAERKYIPHGFVRDCLESLAAASGYCLSEPDLHSIEIRVKQALSQVFH